MDFFDLIFNVNVIATQAMIQWSEIVIEISKNGFIYLDFYIKVLSEYQSAQPYGLLMNCMQP